MSTHLPIAHKRNNPDKASQKNRYIFFTNKFQKHKTVEEILALSRIKIRFKNAGYGGS